MTETEPSSQVSLEGRRVLLLTPPFFGYEKEIAAEFSRRGAQVDFLPDRPFARQYMKGVTRLFPSAVLPLASRFYRREIARFGAMHYDVIFILNGQTLAPELMAEWRTRFPAARTILYMWDSVENRPNFVPMLEFFDARFSFDRQDCEKFGLAFRPLFFVPGFEQTAKAPAEFDLGFIGTLHSDRFAVIRKLRATLPAGLRCFWYLYLQAVWVYHLYRLTNPAMRGARKKDFRFTPLPGPQVRHALKASRVILDIQHPAQRGLTIRTMETLGAQRKLVTTNADIATYDFYDPRNICIIDRDAPTLPADFLETPATPVPPETYRRYSIAGWLDEILRLG